MAAGGTKAEGQRCTARPRSAGIPSHPFLNFHLLLFPFYTDLKIHLFCVDVIPSPFKTSNNNPGFPRTILELDTKAAA